jgi:hypothetical protein
MKCYLIDEIAPADMRRIRGFLEKHAVQSRLEQIYWVKIPDDLLNSAQYEHYECRPHVFAVELRRESIKLEFFIRSLETMRCICPGYATKQQRHFIINYAERMIKELGIKT